MVYSQLTFVVLMALAVGSTAKQNELEKNSATYHDLPSGEQDGIKQFFWSLDKERSNLKVSDAAREAHPSLRQEAIPNQPVALPEGYKEVIPQLPVAKGFLEKVMYVNNGACEIEYESDGIRGTHYISHLWDVKSCYLSTFTTDVTDSSTYVYVMADYDNVMDAEQGKSFSVNVKLYKDSLCTQEANGEAYKAFHDTLPAECKKSRDGSELALLHEDAPARNLKLNKGTSVTLFSSIDDCVTGAGTVQERMSREDNCYNGIQFRCAHEDRFQEYEYEMIKWPNADCSETKKKGSDLSRVVKTKFTRAEGCQQVMPLDATYGHPMINCGQHW